MPSGNPPNPTRPPAGQREPPAQAERTIVIRDRRKPNQYTTDNIIAREWLPILRVGDAFFFYSIYLSMANRETESSWGSLRTQAEYLQCGVDLIIRGNRLLEICELLYIDTGNYRTTNEYYILDPPHLTPELKQRIHQRLDEIEKTETGKNWQSWVRQVRKALCRHRSLPEIWAERRERKDKRPVHTVRPQEETDESPSLLVPIGTNKEATESDRVPHAGHMWDTCGVLVSHNHPACDSQPKQDLQTKVTKQGTKDLDALRLLVQDRCACLGIATSVVKSLLAAHPLHAIVRQIEWLPSRAPRDPAAMLVSAIQGGWGPPTGHDPARSRAVWMDWRARIRQTVDDCVEPADVFVDPADEQDGDVWQIPDSERDAREVWDRVLQEMRMQMTGSTFDLWLRGSRVIAVEDGALAIGVRDEYAQEWLGSHWQKAICRTLSGIAGRALDVRFVVE